MPGGRPKKLNDQEEVEIVRRLAQGETISALAREFRVAKSTLSRNFSGVVTEVQHLARRMAAAEATLQAMPPEDRRAVRALVDAMKAANSRAT